MPQASLLQDVLKQQLDALADAQQQQQQHRSMSENTATSPVTGARVLDPTSPPDHGSGAMALLTPPESDEDDPIDVMSGMATPVPRSRNITRSSSPTRHGRAAHYQTHKPSPLSRTSPERRGDGDLTPRELHEEGGERSLADRLARKMTLATRRDPLRSLPDKVRLLIFCLLDIRDLASCSLVCQRWKKSQTINHAFYQIYRTEAYVGSDLPVGKWTKRESKRDWRSELLKARKIKIKEKQFLQQNEFATPPASYSRPRTPAYRDGGGTPHGSGHLTPRELQEEEWARELETSPTKNEMRSYYKEHGGKRIRKSKAGMMGGMRDRTAWGDD
ncbi:hypothetical protein FRC14_008257 [Serendipita sp. 396]|nr:hypothetical protein FRC14_008257 [Serendipita sp. 396]KAG8786275.1 hypothetical protein FRC15_011772 [Serendipita sp. 397]KAG8835755.1 hypothetical protein FRC18_012376 [Serendipita sp. 400]KAG8870243.1 hypothetical protein FRC20_000160 [Serendipita sp. 405]